MTDPDETAAHYDSDAAQRAARFLHDYDEQAKALEDDGKDAFRWIVDNLTVANNLDLTPESHE